MANPASSHRLLSCTDGVATTTTDSVLLIGRVLLGWLFLHEALTGNELAAFGLFLLGGLFLSIKIDKNSKTYTLSSGLKPLFIGSLLTPLPKPDVPEGQRLQGCGLSRVVRPDENDRVPELDLDLAEPLEVTDGDLRQHAPSLVPALIS